MTKSKTPSIADRLNKPHLVASNPGPGTSAPLPPDPAIRTRIRANIDNTVPFNRNPRQSRNPLYDEIKESIKNKGLESPPVVSRRSPSDPYMIKKGGNTRLAILRELWEETGERRFYEFDCDYEPWTSDLDALVSHMIENEMKGGMLFIEKAIGAVEIKRDLEIAEGISISINELAKRITSLGWSVHQANLNQMLYAHEYLFPVIPESFWSGIGIDRVRRIRKLLDTCRTFWESVATPEEGPFDDVWKPVFRRLDGEAFDVETAEFALSSEMSAKLDSPVLQVRTELQAIEEGLSKGGHRPKDIIKDFVRQQQELRAQQEAARKVPPPPPAPKKNPEPVQSLQAQESVSRDTETGGIAQEAGQSLTQETAAPHVQAPLVQYTAYGDLSAFSYLLDYEVASVQEVAYQAALDYADTFGIAEYVEYIQETGWHLGYRMQLPIGIEQPDQMIHWALLWVYSNTLLDAPELLTELKEVNKQVPYLRGDNLMVVITMAHGFKTDVIAKQIADPQSQPVRWQTLCELEAAMSVIVQAYKDKKPLRNEEE